MSLNNNNFIGKINDLFYEYLQEDKKVINRNLIDYNYTISVDGYPNEYLKFNIRTFSFYDLIGLLKFHENKIFNFDFMDNSNSAHGSGANRQIYQKLANDILNDILIKKNEFFVDINEKNKFWDNLSNIKAFARFIFLLLNSNCVLPYHLPPRYLEILSGYDISIEELEYFYDKMFPDTLSKIDKKYKNNPSEF